MSLTPEGYKLVSGEVAIVSSVSVSKPILTEQPRVISSTDIQQEVRPYFKASRHRRAEIQDSH